ncbi:MAG TPA: carbon-nitrogen hydrolase [Polyangia bacterium]
MNTPKTFRVGLVQMSMSPNVDDNVRKASAKVAEAAAKGAQVVCLPELYRSPYFCQKEDAALFDLAETVPGPSTEAIGAAAKAAKVAVVVPIFEKRAPGLYHNRAVIIDETGANRGIYRKMHIPDDPSFYEKFYFTPGDLGFKTFDLSAGRIGTLICWDQWYPEAARLTALAGAAVLFSPTAIGWHPGEKAQYGASQRDAWKTIQRGHAIANGVYLAAVNRVGHEPGIPGSAGLEFWGTSFLCDPFGVVIAEASVDKEETLVGEVDIGRIEEVRRGWPFLRDRRIDAYGSIDKRFIDQSTSSSSTQQNPSRG